MSWRARDVVLEILQTIFRMLPWPTEPGLRRVGAPHDLSPVIVTANYDLTVRRVLRELEGLDAWLVVAPAGVIVDRFVANLETQADISSGRALDQQEIFAVLKCASLCRRGIFDHIHITSL